MDGLGNIIERTLNDVGQVLTQTIVGNVQSLPVVGDPITDPNTGNILKTVRDVTGKLIEVVFDAAGKVLSTRLV